MQEKLNYRGSVKIPLSIVVLTYNEEKNIDECLASIYNWVDEIKKGHTAYVGHAYLDLVNPVTKSGKLGGEAIFVDTGSGKEGSLSSINIPL